MNQVGEDGEILVDPKTGKIVTIDGVPPQEYILKCLNKRWREQRDIFSLPVFFIKFGGDHFHCIRCRFGTAEVLKMAKHMWVTTHGIEDPVFWDADRKITIKQLIVTLREGKNNEYLHNLRI